MNKKALTIACLCVITFLLQGFAPKHDDDKPVNLKILPKNISEEELHKIMREFSMSLGVRCGYCHVSETVEGQNRPKFDFASDNKPQKNAARNMMRMVTAINENYIGKMIGTDHQLEQITCVTCHMGRTVPIISVDSIRRKVDSVKKN